MCRLIKVKYSWTSSIRCRSIRIKNKKPRMTLVAGLVTIVMTVILHLPERSIFINGTFAHACNVLHANGDVLWRTPMSTGVGYVSDVMLKKYSPPPPMLEKIGAHAKLHRTAVRKIASFVPTLVPCGIGIKVIGFFQMTFTLRLKK